MDCAGLDVHKNFVQACIVNEKNIVIKEQRFDTTSEGLNALRNEVKNACCTIESSTACFRVYDALKEANVKVTVAHPNRLKAIAFAKVKTDKVDARTLAQLTCANLIPKAHLPSKETREQREIVRQHVSLTREMTRLKNRVRAILLKHGVNTPPSLFTQQNQAQAVEKVDGITRTLLEQSFRQLDFLKEQRKQVDALIKQRGLLNEDAVLLKTLPGVGWFSALLLAAEIDGVQRFPDCRHLQSYAGIVPSVRQSGSVTYVGRISKQGSKLMRWALIQNAWHAVRESKRFRKKFLRTARKRGVKKAIVAVARKMLECSYFMLKRRQAFAENA
jgi:transposase